MADNRSDELLVNLPVSVGQRIGQHDVSHCCRVTESKSNRSGFEPLRKVLAGKAHTVQRRAIGKTMGRLIDSAGVEARLAEIPDYPHSLSLAVVLRLF